MTQSSANGVTAGPARRPRVVLYSHDTMGLGHMRRNLLLAQSLAAQPLGASVLLVAGSNDISGLRLPAGVDCLSLPALQKSPLGKYASRRLDICLDEIIELRGRLILSAVESFKPDAFIVDNKPRGACGELDPVLECLSHDPLVRSVLGLRDVLDETDTVKREWRREENFATVRTCYDAVWVYGDLQAFDPISAGSWPTQLRNKVEFVGYLDPRQRLELKGPEADSSSPERPRPYILCQCGGGQDGYRLARLFLNTELPDACDGIILTGPCMPVDEVAELRQMARQKRSIIVRESAPEADELIANAERVVAMGGYNTLCSAICHRKPTLVVPRESPRQEQLIRAQRFAQLSLVDVLPLNGATSRAMTNWMQTEPLYPNPQRLDFDGLQRIPRLLNDVLNRSRRIEECIPALQENLRDGA